MPALAVWRTLVMGAFPGEGLGGGRLLIRRAGLTLDCREVELRAAGDGRGLPARVTVALVAMKLNMDHHTATIQCDDECRREWGSRRRFEPTLAHDKHRWVSLTRWALPHTRVSGGGTACPRGRCQPRGSRFLPAKGCRWVSKRRRRYWRLCSSLLARLSSGRNCDLLRWRRCRNSGTR